MRRSPKGRSLTAAPQTSGAADSGPLADALVCMTRAHDTDTRVHWHECVWHERVRVGNGARVCSCSPIWSIHHTRKGQARAHGCCMGASLVPCHAQVRQGFRLDCVAAVIDAEAGPEALQLPVARAQVQPVTQGQTRT